MNDLVNLLIDGQHDEIQATIIRSNNTSSQPMTIANACSAKMPDDKIMVTTKNNSNSADLDDIVDELEKLDYVFVCQDGEDPELLTQAQADKRWIAQFK
jgi:MoaA/NifB/PqqE/SkfB family radical SAM enzyme